MRPATHEDAQARVKQATLYGFLDLDRVVRAAEVANEIDYSSSRFQRLLRAMTGGGQGRDSV
jgi:hypothetical protein